MLCQLVFSFVYEDIELVDERAIDKRVNKHGFLSENRVDCQNGNDFVKLKLA